MFLTTDELDSVYDLAYDHAYEGLDTAAGAMRQHRAGLEALAEAVLADHRGNKVEKLIPQMIGKIITIQWTLNRVKQASTGRLVAYTIAEFGSAGLWFEGTDPKGYVVSNHYTLTVHGGAA
jgi:hypothetical protein